MLADMTERKRREILVLKIADYTARGLILRPVSLLQFAQLKRSGFSVSLFPIHIRRIHNVIQGRLLFRFNVPVYLLPQSY